MQMTVPIDGLDGFSSQFWDYVKDARVFAFHGEMGAGKTTIISALCRKKGVKEPISSPTFSIINQYFFLEDGKEKSFFHIDLYRLKDEEEVSQAGVEDCIFSGFICMIEWPEKASLFLEESTVHVYIENLNATTRSVKIQLPALVSQNNRNL
jgi:tRNA threonylcarbamoyladenosine biosynthesis protein TsaE